MNKSITTSFLHILVMDSPVNPQIHSLIPSPIHVPERPKRERNDIVGYINPQTLPLKLFLQALQALVADPPPLSLLSWNNVDDISLTLTHHRYTPYILEHHHNSFCCLDVS